MDGDARTVGFPPLIHHGAHLVDPCPGVAVSRHRPRRFDKQQMRPPVRAFISLHAIRRTGEQRLDRRMPQETQRVVRAHRQILALQRGGHIGQRLVERGTRLLRCECRGFFPHGILRPVEPEIREQLRHPLALLRPAGLPAGAFHDAGCLQRRGQRLRRLRHQALVFRAALDQHHQLVGFRKTLVKRPQSAHFRRIGRQHAEDVRIKTQPSDAQRRHQHPEPQQSHQQHAPRHAGRL